MTLAGGEGEGGSANSQNPDPFIYNRWLEREYIWGPGDNGLDELLGQFDRERRAWFALQDAGGDVIGLVERLTTPPPSSSGDLPTQRVTFTASQFTYGAYGEVLSAETLRAPPTLHLGHKGLFFDRLDGGIADPMTGAETPRLEPGAQLLGYARNRSYSPRLGRWLQKDTNATAGVLLGLARHGFGCESN